MFKLNPVIIHFYFQWMKEPKCGVFKFTSFTMFVSWTISLSAFQKSSMLYMFTSQNPANFTPVARIHHPAGWWAVSTMSQAGVPMGEHFLLHWWCPTNSHCTETATNTHTYIHTQTHMENKTKQRCTTLIEKYWTNMRHCLI